MSEPTPIGPIVIETVAALATQTTEQRLRDIVSQATGPIPRLGSPEWCALPIDSPESRAAIARAAWCWFTDGQNFAENLARSLETSQRENKRLDDEEYSARRDAHRAEQKRTNYRPHPANRRSGICVWCGSDKGAA